MNQASDTNIRWLSRASALLLNNVQEAGFARMLRRLLHAQTAFSSMQMVIYPQQQAAINLYDWHYGEQQRVDEFCFHSSLSGGAKLRLCLGRNQQLGPFDAAERQFIADVSMILSSLLIQHGEHCLQNQTQAAAEAESVPVSSLESQLQSYSCAQQELTPLTQREAEVTAMVLKGHTSLSVGLVLGIATETVKMHRKRVYKKLQVGTQAELFARLSHLLVA
jgi:DNA-binding CsgD family transcriptional regulator